MATAAVTPRSLRVTGRREQARLSARDDGITIFLGLWLMAGVFIDGWAHNSRTLVESFFTPWHAILYAGYGASSAWLCWLLLAQRRAGRVGMSAIPLGYGLGFVGALIFGLGGLGDMVWHGVFGVEVGLEQLLSPTHLLLFVGVLLILTSPFRSAWASPDPSIPVTLRSLLPALLALTAAVSAISFISAYLWAIISDASSVEMVHFYAGRIDGVRLLNLSQRSGVSSILLTNVVLIAPLLLALRRWLLPFGSVTLLFTMNTILMNVLEGFAFTERILAALVAGIAADALIRALRPTVDRPLAVRLFAGLVPLIFWSLFFLASWLRRGIGWPPELWTGAIVLTVLSGLGLSLLLVPPALPEQQRAATS
jgi:hypothetical protein